MQHWRCRPRTLSRGEGIEGKRKGIAYSQCMGHMDRQEQEIIQWEGRSSEWTEGYMYF